MTIELFKTHLKILVIMVVIAVVAVLSVMLANSRSDIATLRSDNDVLNNDNTLQEKVIAMQAFNFNRFNQVAEHASSLNSLIDVGTEKNVVEYREILKREKTCDLPVPADVAGGLLDYANRLRTSAMHADTSFIDTADAGSSSASTMTYCQAVLWIKPLLSLIEKGNNNFAGIRQIEQARK